MKFLLLAIGMLCLLVGLLWIGQGTGYIAWPRSSFMISQMQWAYYGAANALGLGWYCGLKLVFVNQQLVGIFQ